MTLFNNPNLNSTVYFGCLNLPRLLIREFGCKTLKKCRIWFSDHRPRRRRPRWCRWWRRRRRWIETNLFCFVKNLEECFSVEWKNKSASKKVIFLWQASKQNKKARETFSTNNFLLLLKTWSGPFPHLAALLMKKLFPLSSVKISALTQKMNDEQKPLLGIRSDKTEREREK